MKVALVGNMNNNFHALLRHLRDIGIDAHLLMQDNEFEHFTPINDSYKIENQKFIKQLDWGSPKSFFSTSKAKIVADLKEYDFIFGTDYVPAFCEKIGRKLDLFFPYGSDLLVYPFFHLYLKPHLLIGANYLSKFQLQGIQNARYVQIAWTANNCRKELNRIEPKGTLLYEAFPMIYVEKNEEFSETTMAFKEIREKSDLLIFSHARHNWKSKMHFANLKNNNYTINALANFIKNNPSVKTNIIFFEYGEDVCASKELIRNLQIEKNVFWFPKEGRKKILNWIKLSDIGIGDFSNGWFANGVVLEILSMGKPIIHFRNDALYEEFFPEMYPIYNANTSEKIELGFNSFWNDKGEKSKDSSILNWFNEYIIEKPLRRYLSILK